MEQIIYIILLAIHNIAAVICIAGPFYMARITGARSKYGKKVIYDKDRIMEDVITTQPRICLAALGFLAATGLAFPAVHYAFHGEFLALTVPGWVALWVKLLAVAGIAVILYWGAFIFNPKLKAIFSHFKPGENSDPQLEQEFFALRALRKYWCDRCWNLGLIVLIATAVIRWS